MEFSFLLFASVGLLLKKRCFHRKCAHVLYCLIKISILFILLCVLNMFHNPSTSTQLSKVPSNDVQIVSGLLFFPFTQSKKSSKDIQIVSLFFIYLHSFFFFFKWHFSLEMTNMSCTQLCCRVGLSQCDTGHSCKCSNVPIQSWVPEWPGP